MVFLKLSSISISLFVDEIVRSKPSVTTSSGGATARITVSTRQAITEFHPTVLELTDAEYSKEQAIEAVERCGPDIQACMDYMYLMTDEGEGELFRSSLSVERDRVVQTQPMEEDFTTSQTLVFSHDLSPHAVLNTCILYVV